VHSVEIGGVPVSSSRIRSALCDGDPGAATHLLSRPFAMRATVERGDQRGRTLGYPTANLRLGEYQRPKYGIYAVRVALPDGSEHDGVASLGVRPTFDPPVELLEAFLFDWAGDLYGQTIEVALHHYLRGEERFDSAEALTEAMRQDEAHARDLLGTPAPR
jgi:riboflavin kinase/FMN adenylyltransferase